VSALALLAATASLGALMGRLAAEPQLRRLRRLLGLAYHAAGHDRLTALPNRLLADQVFAARERRGQPTIVVLLDLDHFKQINDAYGHHVGDDLLRSIADHLAATAQAHDGSAARLGGDEFLLLLAAHGNPAEVVEQILRAVAQPTLLPTGDSMITVKPSASAGITVYDGRNGSLATLLHQADIALYQAKKHRGGHCTYTPAMRMPRNATRHGPRLRDEHPTDHDRQAGGQPTS
jgi:diguanylate cyclase (GGDEF)-like protein